MSKIAILLCAMVVASLDASAKDQFKDEITSTIERGLSELEEKYNEMMEIYDKVYELYLLIGTKCFEDFNSHVAKAWDELDSVGIAISDECDERNNCSSAFLEIAQVVEDYSGAQRRRAWNFLFNGTNVSETHEQYARANSTLTDLKNKLLSSSQYNKTTQLEATSYNETLYKEVTEEINKLLTPVLKIIEASKNTLLSRLSDPFDYWKDSDISAYSAEVDEGVRKAKECYKQCQLEEQSQNSTAAD